MLLISSRGTRSSGRRRYGSSAFFLSAIKIPVYGAAACERGENTWGDFITCARMYVVAAAALTASKKFSRSNFSSTFEAESTSLAERDNKRRRWRRRDRTE